MLLAYLLLLLFFFCFRHWCLPSFFFPLCAQRSRDASLEEEKRRAARTLLPLFFSFVHRRRPFFFFLLQKQRWTCERSSSRGHRKSRSAARAWKPRSPGKTVIIKGRKGSVWKGKKKREHASLVHVFVCFFFFLCVCSDEATTTTTSSALLLTF